MARIELVDALSLHFRVAVMDDEACALTDAYERIDPAVLVIEQFPFGTLTRARRVCALLNAAISNPRTLLIACSVLDVPQADHDSAAREGDRSQHFAEKYFDVVFVHANPHARRLEDACRPQRPFLVPVLYGDARTIARVATRLVEAAAAFRRALHVVS
jgi:hypothetical protein